MFPAANEDQIKAVLDFLSDRLEETGYRMKALFDQ